MNPDTFFEHFDLLADAPNGVQKLREMVLQLAVSGKLVPQDPDDEPAAVLLERIRTEKDRLVKQGKIKKSEPLPPIQPDEAPYSLPDGWEWIRVGNLFDFEYGKGLPKESIAVDGKIPAYGANGIIKYCREPLVKNHCIIVGRKGSAGAVNKVSEPCWPLDVTFYIQPPKILNFEYVYRLLLSLSLEKLAKGIKPGLNRNEAYLLIFGLPPVEEQTRIVAKVDQLMALCDELEAKKQKRNELRTQVNVAAMDKLLSAQEPDAFNESWRRVAENFDLLYDTPETVGKLRQAILQLAVSGKLAPQNPADEPASLLLERIRTEKDRL
ncbi:MAG: restriction endonuclease subunit S, partial [Desulfobacteraceae bacterium]|nr:restriction endonuclease subunit S [Desulfobacteraceae bacterium]